MEILEFFLSDGNISSCLQDFRQGQNAQIYSEIVSLGQLNRLEVEKNCRVVQWQIDRFHLLYQKQKQN